MNPNVYKKQNLKKWRVQNARIWERSSDQPTGD